MAGGIWSPPAAGGSLWSVSVHSLSVRRSACQPGPNRNLARRTVSLLQSHSQLPHSTSLNSIHQRGELLTRVPWISSIQSPSQSPDQTTIQHSFSPGSDPSRELPRVLSSHIDAFLFKVNSHIPLKMLLGVSHADEEAEVKGSRACPASWAEGRGWQQAADTGLGWPPQSMPFLSPLSSFRINLRRAHFLSNGSCTGSRAGRNICFLIQLCPQNCRIS